VALKYDPLPLLRLQPFLYKHRKALLAELDAKVTAPRSIVPPKPKRQMVTFEVIPDPRFRGDWLLNQDGSLAVTTRHPTPRQAPVEIMPSLLRFGGPGSEPASPSGNRTGILGTHGTSAGARGTRCNTSGSFPGGFSKGLVVGQFENQTSWSWQLTCCVRNFALSRYLRHSFTVSAMYLLVNSNCIVPDWTLVAVSFPQTTSHRSIFSRTIETHLPKFAFPFGQDRIETLKPSGYLHTSNAVIVSPA